MSGSCGVKGCMILVGGLGVLQWRGRCYFFADTIINFPISKHGKELTCKDEIGEYWLWQRPLSRLRSSVAVSLDGFVWTEGRGDCQPLMTDQGQRPKPIIMVDNINLYDVPPIYCTKKTMEKVQAYWLFPKIFFVFYFSIDVIIKKKNTSLTCIFCFGTKENLVSQNSALYKLFLYVDHKHHLMGYGRKITWCDHNIIWLCLFQGSKTRDLVISFLFQD